VNPAHIGIAIDSTHIPDFRVHRRNLNRQSGKTLRQAGQMTIYPYATGRLMKETVFVDRDALDSSEAE